MIGEKNDKGKIIEKHTVTGKIKCFMYGPTIEEIYQWPSDRSMYTLWRERTAWGAWVQPSAHTAADAAPMPGSVFWAAASAFWH